MTARRMPRTRFWDLEAVLSERQLALLLVAPALLVLALLIGWSVLYALFLSFQHLVVSGGNIQYHFIGLANYLGFFSDARLHQAMGQTIYYSFFRVVGILGIGLTLALLLNRAVPGVGVLKRLFLIPWALSNVVNATAWGWIYHGSYGVLNAVLTGLHLTDKYQVWLAEPGSALLAIVFAEVWKSVPFSALMILAALQGVPRDLEDASKVDGAGVWARFANVTLPCIRPVLLVLLVIETMWALKAFDLIWVLTQGGPLDRTEILNVFAYEQTFRFFNFGYGAAVAYLITVLILGLTAVYVATLRGFGD